MKEELLQYKVLAKFLKEALSDRYTVSLIDADDPTHELSVEDRSLVPAPSESTAIISEILGGEELKKRDYLCSFSEEGKTSNSYLYVRDGKGDVVGFLCIGEKESDKVTVREVFEQLLSTDETPTYSQNIGDEIDALMREKIAEVWGRYKTPGARLKKSDKIAFTLELLELGIFRMKGGAVQVSKVTGISLASIYRYLAEAVEE